MGSKTNRPVGFTIVELLVVISIITVIIGILLPAFTAMRHRARDLVKQSGMRDVWVGLSQYATDNQGVLPESVATVGDENTFVSWQDPTMITGFTTRAPGYRRSLSAYLTRYISGPEILICPYAPEPLPYWKDAWHAGDSWNNPRTPTLNDSLYGTFNHYWGYRGALAGGQYVFEGPTLIEGRRTQSNLLLCDNLNFANTSVRTFSGFTSCERLPHDFELRDDDSAQPIWASNEPPHLLAELSDSLKAVFLDGHIETYSSLDTYAMEVSKSLDGSTPYTGTTPGYFFIPRTAVKDIHRLVRR